MKDLMKSNYHNHHGAAASSSRPAMNKDSHVISKLKPKIRIIHIFAPEIIKTDVASFRGLVQRLTGKPAEGKTRKSRSKNTNRPTKSVFTSQDSGCDQASLNGFRGLLMNGGNVVKEEWEGESSDPFFDLEGLIKDYGDGFSSLPMRSSQVDDFLQQQF